jgi:hypothetical protein
MTTFEASRGNRGHQLMTKELSSKIPKLYSQEEVSDPTVVAHYFTPYGRGDWFVIEWDGQDLMYGLADLGYPELGYFSLSELESAYRGSLPLVERDLYWTPVPLSEVKKTRMSAETFEAPKTMTPLQAKKRFLALMKPYWLKDLKESRGPKLSRKQHIAEHGDDDWYEAYLEDWDWWDYHVKTVQSGKYGEATVSGDTFLRESLPFTYYDFIDNIAGRLPEEMQEKYDYDNGFELENLYDDETHACIVDGEPSWEDYSTADKRKLNALEKRWDSDKISSEEYSDTWDKITSKYSTQKFHKNEASRFKCRYCGPVIKATNNMNNWNWEFLEYDDFWNECKKEKIPVRELKSLTNIILGKAKPQPKPKATTKPTAKAKPKATKAKSGRKAPTISATKRKIGTRMRGNDGNMWEVKPAGKSQRWVRGAETFEAESESLSLVAIDLEYEGIEYCDYFIVHTNKISGFSEQEMVSYFYDLEEEDWTDENTFEPMMSHPTEVQEVMVWSLTPEEEKVLIKFGISGRYL